MVIVNVIVVVLVIGVVIGVVIVVVVVVLPESVRAHGRRWERQISRHPKSEH